MYQNWQGSPIKPPHHPPYNLRNTLKRQEDATAKSKSEPPKRSSPFSVSSAYNSVVEGVLGTFSKKRMSSTVSETSASSLGRPTVTSTPASSFPRDLILNQSRVEAPTQNELGSQLPIAIRKASVRSSTSSAAEDQPTVIERTGIGIYMDESRVFGQTDFLKRNQAQSAPTLKFSTESDQVFRSEEQDPLDDQGPLRDLGLGSLTVEREVNE